MAREVEASFGNVEDVWICEERPGADPCRWIGPGDAGGVIVHVDEWSWSGRDESVLEVTFVDVPATLARVELSTWRMTLRRGDDERWALAEAVLTGIS